jgi:hypothetical protein
MVYMARTSLIPGNGVIIPPPLDEHLLYLYVSTILGAPPSRFLGPLLLAVALLSAQNHFSVCSKAKII